MLEHLAERVFTDARCAQLLAELSAATTQAQQRAEAQRRQLQAELDALDTAIERWPVAFESGAASIEALGADRLRDLKARRQAAAEQLARARVPARPPTWLATPATIQAFRDRLRQRLTAGDTFARNYLRFLVERIVVQGDRVDLTIKAHAAVTLFAARNAENRGAVNPDAPVLTSKVDWLRLLDAYRTACMAPNLDTVRVFAEACEHRAGARSDRSTAVPARRQPESTTPR